MSIAFREIVNTDNHCALQDKKVEYCEDNKSSVELATLDDAWNENVEENLVDLFNTLKTVRLFKKLAIERKID